MKCVFIALGLVFLRVVGPAQVPSNGWNGAGFFDVYPPQVKEWLYGDYVLRYRADKEIGVPKTLDSVIRLNNYYTEEGKTFAIVYCAGMVNTTPDQNIIAINYLIVNNVNILSIELGNEPYNEKECNFDFNCYKQEFEPLVNKVKTLWPDMPVSYFTAPNPIDAGLLGGSTKHKIFNDELAAYMETFAQPEDEISSHIYFKNREIPILDDTFLVKKRIYDPEQYYADLDYFYTTLFYTGYEHLWIWDSTLFYLQDKFPSRWINITEFGIATRIDVPGGIKNTIAYHALMSAVWNKYKHWVLIKTMLEHNGNAPAGAGCITPANRNTDFNPNGYESLPRLALHTYNLQRDFPAVSADASKKIEYPGTYQYHFINMAELGAWMQLNIADNLQFVSASATYISGANSYSSSGYCSFMAPGSVKNYEITGPETQIFDSVDDLYMPAWSYGYLTIEFKQKEIKPVCIPACKKWRYVVWHWRICKACFE